MHKSEAGIRERDRQQLRMQKSRKPFQQEKYFVAQTSLKYPLSRGGFT